MMLEIRKMNNTVDGTYLPTAVYYEQSDSLEYVRADVPCVYRRVDELLTLVLDMASRNPIGFRIKGFRYFYKNHFESLNTSNNQIFTDVIRIIETALTEFGDKLFEQKLREHAYNQAIQIASEDNVKFRNHQIRAQA